jgi:23S rRNA (guanosine2251-2'-O)-methyltransferase
VSRIVFGIQPVREVIHAGANRCERILVATPLRGRPSPKLEALARYARSQQVQVEQVDTARLDSLAKGTQHQGIAAIAPDLIVLALNAVLARKPSLLTVLDRFSDPQNFGAALRSSVAFGADAVVWPEHDNAPLTPATFRASAGAVEHATLCRVPSLPRALQQLGGAGLQVIGLAGDGPHLLADLDLTAPVALVIGSEGFGMRKAVRAACHAIARLPAGPPLDTVNASVATGIALYEVRRQRSAPPRAAAHPVDTSHHISSI